MIDVQHSELLSTVWYVRDVVQRELDYQAVVACSSNL